MYNSGITRSGLLDQTHMDSLHIKVIDETVPSQHVSPGIICFTRSVTFRAKTNRNCTLPDYAPPLYSTVPCLVFLEPPPLRPNIWRACSTQPSKDACYTTVSNVVSGQVSYNMEACYDEG